MNYAKPEVVFVAEAANMIKNSMVKGTPFLYESVSGRDIATHLAYEADE
jgi:hypothetical protein